MSGPNDDLMSGTPAWLHRQGPQSPYNAIVTSDAPIQPPQAFVDNIVLFILVAGAPLDVSSSGITYINPDLIIASDASTGWMSSAYNISQDLNMNLSGNALSQSNIDNILIRIKNAVAIYSYPIGTIDLSGPEMAIPSEGRGAAPAQYLVDNGWMIATGQGGSSNPPELP